MPLARARADACAREGCQVQEARNEKYARNQRCTQGSRSAEQWNGVEHNAVTLHGGCSRFGWKYCACVSAFTRRRFGGWSSRSRKTDGHTRMCLGMCCIFLLARRLWEADKCMWFVFDLLVWGKSAFSEILENSLEPNNCIRLTPPLAMSALTSGEVSEVAYCPDNVSTRRDSSTAGVRCQLELHCPPFSKSAPVARET